MNIASALHLLKEQWEDLKTSSIYKSTAREIEDQDDFLNLVCSFEVSQSPEEILSILQQIESGLHKSLPYRYGPRTIDLDLLLYDDLVLDTPDLVIPHPKMHERRFVLDPLCEIIDPDTLHPMLQKPWKALKEAVKRQGCTPLSS